MSMQSLNVQFESLRQSPTVAMADRITALKAGGQEIIGLQVGDPDFPTPPAVLDVAFRAMQDGLTHYGPSRGYPEMRRAAALRLERDLVELLLTYAPLVAAGHTDEEQGIPVDDLDRLRRIAGGDLAQAHPSAG